MIIKLCNRRRSKSINYTYIHFDSLTNFVFLCQWCLKWTNWLCGWFNMVVSRFFIAAFCSASKYIYHFGDLIIITEFDIYILNLKKNAIFVVSCLHENKFDLVLYMHANIQAIVCYSFSLHNLNWTLNVVFCVHLAFSCKKHQKCFYHIILVSAVPFNFWVTPINIYFFRYNKSDRWDMGNI